MKSLPLFSDLFPTIVTLLVASPVSFSAEWSRHSFALPESIWSVDAVDLNADKRLDLIAMGEKKVYALIAPTWEQHVILDSVEPKMLYCAALDADGDGDVDIALGRYRVPWIEYREAVKTAKRSDIPKGPDFSIAWIENTGNVGKQFPLHVVDRELNGIHGLTVADLNGDGRKDLVAGSIIGPFFPNSLAWFSAPAAHKTGFRRHVITHDGADGRPHYLDTADVNKDGMLDVLLGDSKGGTFTWWQNGTWRKHEFARESGATNIRATDINNDGELDVVGSCGHGKGVFWFEGPAWTKRHIDSDFATPHALTIGDFDKDGDTDVAAASFSTQLVRYYENDGKGGFKPLTIDSGNRQEAYDLKSLDLNTDGRIDLVLAGRESRNAVWYENQK